MVSFPQTDSEEIKGGAKEEIGERGKHKNVNEKREKN